MREEETALFVDDFLSHYGAKGMHWGIRKAEDTKGNNVGKSQIDISADRKAKAKKIAIGVGILVVVAGAGYAAYTLNKNGKLPLSSMRSATPSSAKKIAETVSHEPTTMIHATRGRDVGFQFFKKGGVPDALVEYTKAGFTEDDRRENFKRYGKSGEKVAARFFDPEGRHDFAGRIIPHEVIVPASMSNGINSLDDVKTKIWPLLKPDYDILYNSPGAVERRGF